MRAILAHLDLVEIFLMGDRTWFDNASVDDEN